MSTHTKPTHVIIEKEDFFLERGERVYIVRDEGHSCWVQSVNPSYKDGRWHISKAKMAPIYKPMVTK